MSITDQYVQCLACDEDVRVESIDNLTDIDPMTYGILLYAEKCKCGFKTVLEYVCDMRYSHTLSVEESNEDKDGLQWYAHQSNRWVVGKEEDE